ncbi:MAG: N-acetyltransferase [Proteobacteria bacterium]|nr:MAG: N-acetyltransferase [Pseudomonadota bacterium]
MINRIKVEALRVDHAEELFLDLQDSRIFPYISEKQFPTLPELTARYEMLVGGPRAGRPEKWLNWVMYDRLSSATIGTLQATIMTDERIAIVAYVVWPKLWRQGYASEGLDWLLDFLKNQPEVDTAVAYIDVRNMASIRLVEKSGFALKETITTPDDSDHIYYKTFSLLPSPNKA